MIAARVLRIGAIAIAIGGLADPALTRDAAVRQPLAIVIVDAAGLPSAQRLRTLLESEYDVAAYAPGDTSGAAACPEQGGCIVVSDGRVPPRLSAGSLVIGAVRSARSADSVVIADVSLPGTVHVTAASSLQVRLIGDASSIDVFDGDVRVGTADVGEGGADRHVNVPWVPIETGARVLTVRAAGAQAHAPVIVRDAAAPVLFYEPEATWLGTFVRRTLENDPRFALVGRTRLAPPVSVTRGGVGPLTSGALDEVSVVVVTAPDALGGTDVDLLERFVRVRGGSVLVLPDRRPSGAVMRLVPDVAAERREMEPAAVGALKATEILSFNADAPGISVIESAGGRPAIVSRAIGRGRVVVSGALDAWRYRDGGAFGGFWTALVADAAAAAGPTLALTVDPPVLAPGAEARVTAEWRSIEALPADITAESVLTCGERRSVVRLWPGARAGLFFGTMRPESDGDIDCELAVTAAKPARSSRDTVAVRGTHNLKLVGAALSAPADLAQLDAAMAAHGGVVVTSGDEPALADRVRERMPPRRQARQTRPMHSPWWILPFAACLGGEWWLRRRAGLR